MPSPHPLSRRPTYALTALQKYLKHISLPSSHQTSILSNLPKNDAFHGVRPSDWGTSSNALQALGTLQKYQQAAVPFSNLYLHYAQFYTGSPLDHEAMWRYLVQGTAMVGGSAGYARSLPESHPLQVMNETKIVEELMGREWKWEGRKASGGRGGTCTLNNGFFGTVMRSLGMRVVSTGARVSMGYGGDERMEGRFAGWNHMVNLVEMEGRWWLVDVGFGGDGPTAPLELVDGNAMQWGNTLSHVRLIHTSLAEHTDPTSKVWILQHRASPSSHWKDTYCFTTTEFLPQDIKVMNYSTTADVRGSFFNHVVICQKTVLKGENIVGTLGLLNGKVKKTVWEEEKGEWKKETLVECKSEVERWEALEKWFGIVLGEEERRGIKGLVSELKGKAED